MVWLVILVRTLVGLLFMYTGITYFTMPTPPLEGMPQNAELFAAILLKSHYMTAIKVLEILGGLNLLTGYFAPFGLAILIPIALNIVFFELFLVGSPGIGCVVLGMLLFVMLGYGSTVRQIFDGSARIG